MAVSDISELGAALATGDFERVTGTPEQDWVDFKAQGYESDPDRAHRLTEPGRWELCKDVAAFANAGGGSILIGYPDARDPATSIATAGDPAPVPTASINVDAYQKTITDGPWLFPKPRRVRCTWHQRDGDSASGIFEIHVPPQDEALKPFVMRRTLATDTIVQAVGIPEREADRTYWLPPEQVHQEMNAGRMARNRWPEADLPRMSGDEAHTHAEATIAELRDLRAWSDRAVYYLQSLPPTDKWSDRMSGFFNQLGVVDSLRRPKSLRPSGFNLETLGPVDVVGGSAVAMSFHESTARLEPNGLLTAGWLADPEMLGWGLNSTHTTGLMRVNPLALVELTLEFFRFVTDTLMSQIAGQWTHRVICLRFADHGVALPRGVGRRVPPATTYPPTSNDWRKQFASDSDEGDHVAFEALSRVYALFALGEDAIPYADPGTRTVSEAEILAA